MMTVASEVRRLQTLQSYDVLDTPEEESFDRITRIASTILQTPIALISLVDGHRQWFKSHLGFDMRETPREISFCTHAIQGKSALLVPDAMLDPRFRDNPLVVGDPNIRFYLGVPLRMHNGENIGTLCTIDTAPRAPTSAQIAMLTDLARMVVDEMELRQIATTDSLTGALTRRGLELRLESELERSHRYGRVVSLVAIDLDHFKSVNDRFGHAAGDLLLQSVVQACRRALRAVDLIARAGGEEFIVVLPETTGAMAEIVAERLRTTIAALILRFDAVELRVTASLGVTSIAPEDESASQAMRRADAALYRAKALGRNRVVVDLDAPEPSQGPSWSAVAAGGEN